MASSSCVGDTSIMADRESLRDMLRKMSSERSFVLGTRGGVSCLRLSFSYIAPTQSN